MTRVLHVLEAAGFGTGRHLRTLVTHVDEVEHHVVVPPVRHRGGEQRLPTVGDTLAAGGTTVHHLPLRRNPAHPDTVRSLAALSSLVKRLRPDVVHGHSSIGGALARLAARRHGLPAVYTPHGLRPDRGSLAVERLLSPWSTRVVAVSPSEAEQVVRLGLAPRDRVRMIPNALSPMPPPPADPGVRDLFALATAPVVGYVGRLGHEKAPDLVVDAVALLSRTIPEVQAVVVAVGPGAVRFDRDLEARGLAGRVHRLPGWPDAATLLPGFDVLVAPSRREAGPSFVVLEAMRAGVPVVVTDVVGLRDAVDDGVDGLRVPVEDPPALAEAVARLLVDPGLADRLRRAAADRIQARHDPATFGDAHARLYAELAGSARP